MEIRFLRLDEVIRITGLSRAAIYQLMQRGEFPRQYRINERSVAWFSTEVQEWIAKIRATRAA